MEKSLNLYKILGSRFVTNVKESLKCGFILHFNHEARNKEHFKDCKLQE